MNTSTVWNVVIVVMAILAVYFVAHAVRQIRRRKLIGGAFSVLSALFLALAATTIALIGIGLQGFQRLTYERTAAELQFSQTGERAYNAIVHYPDGSVGQYPILGDEWQIDTRMLSFKPLANLVGFDSAYRLERFGGRYRDIEDEKKAPRTVHALSPPSSIDLWEIARRHREWNPWVDAYYGTATYVPLADGARYAVNVTQSGLKARPLNDSAKKALGNW